MTGNCPEERPNGFSRSFIMIKRVLFRIETDAPSGISEGKENVSGTLFG